MVIAGIDGCRGGWISFRVDVTSLESSVEYVDLPSVLRNKPDDLAMLAIDIPVGLLGGSRACDKAARKLLGQPRLATALKRFQAFAYFQRVDRCAIHTNSIPKRSWRQELAHHSELVTCLDRFDEATKVAHGRGGVFISLRKSSVTKVQIAAPRVRMVLPSMASKTGAVRASVRPNLFENC